MSDVAVLRLQAGKANAMTEPVLDTIVQLVDDFERGPARAAVLTGYERYFSGGLAVPALIDLDRDAMRRFITRFSDAMMRVFACDKPIVAAVNGHAIAGGCVLALQCDHRVMTDGDGRIGLNETQLGIGLPAIVLEALRLAVPASSLVSIAYAGRLFSPHEACELGLVDEVAADAEIRAMARATELAAVPPVALAQVKRAIRHPAIDAIRAGAARETEAWLDTWFSADAQARLRAMVAKLRG
jgi:enoyl-CoA hydratase